MMLHRFFWPATFLFLLSACGSDADSGSDSAIDSLTGLDTSRVLISDADLNAAASGPLFPFLDGAAMGFADSTGKLVVPARYESVRPFQNGLAQVRLNGRYGLINQQGEEVLAPEYTSLSDFACGALWLGTEEGYVLVNQEGKRILPGTYDRAFAFTGTDNRIPVDSGGKIDFYDPQGNRITEMGFDRVGRYAHGVAPVLSLKAGQHGWGLLNEAGEMIVPFLYQKLFPFYEGLGVASLVDANGHERFGVINPEGDVVIPFTYGNISGTGSEGFFVARRYGEREAEKELLTNASLILDHAGEVKATLDFMLWDEFSEGLVVAEKDGLFGYVDTTGQVVIPFQFEWACPFSEGLAWVKGPEHYGFIDHSGNFAIPPQYIANEEYVLMQPEGVLVADPVSKELFYLDAQGREYRK